MDLEFQPRVFTSEQRRKLIALLSAEPKGDIHVNCVTGNRESCQFARQFANVLIAAGWTIKRQAGMLVHPVSYQGGPPVGLIIEFRNLKTIPQRVFLLSNAITSVGLSVRREFTETVATDTDVTLSVGVMP